MEVRKQDHMKNSKDGLTSGKTELEQLPNRRVSNGTQTDAWIPLIDLPDLPRYLLRKKSDDSSGSPVDSLDPSTWWELASNRGARVQSRSEASRSGCFSGIPTRSVAFSIDETDEREDERGVRSAGLHFPTRSMVFSIDETSDHSNEAGIDSTGGEPCRKASPSSSLGCRAATSLRAGTQTVSQIVEESPARAITRVAQLEQDLASSMSRTEALRRLCSEARKQVQSASHALARGAVVGTTSVEGAQSETLKSNGLQRRLDDLVSLLSLGEEVQPVQEEPPSTADRKNTCSPRSCASTAVSDGFFNRGTIGTIGTVSSAVASESCATSFEHPQGSYPVARMASGHSPEQFAASVSGSVSLRFPNPASVTVSPPRSPTDSRSGGSHAGSARPSSRPPSRPQSPRTPQGVASQNGSTPTISVNLWLGGATKAAAYSSSRAYSCPPSFVDVVNVGTSAASSCDAQPLRCSITPRLKGRRLQKRFSRVPTPPPRGRVEDILGNCRSGSPISIRSSSPNRLRPFHVRRHFRQRWTLEREERFFLQ